MRAPVRLRTPSRWDLGPLLVAALAYVGLSKLAQHLLLVDGVAAVWPSAGVGLVCVWRFGWWGLLAIAPADFVVSITPPAEIGAGVALGTTVANCAAPVAGAACLNAVGFRPALERRRDVFALCAAAALTVIGAVLGVLALWLGDVTDAPWDSFRSWVLSDAVGVVLVGGLLFALPAAGRAAGGRRNVGMAVGLAVAAGLLALLGFEVWTPTLLALFPALVATAYLGRRLGALLAAVAVAIPAVLTTAHGNGPFGDDLDLVEVLLLLQAFVTLQALTMMTLAVDLDARDAAQRELRRQARLDRLTGLANRVALMEHLAATCADARPHGLAVVNVDRFRRVNDAIGQRAADEVLRLLAARVAAAASGRFVARLGADAFAVVSGRPGDLPELTEAVLAAIEAPLTLDGQELRLSASAGVADWSAADEPDGEQLVRMADVAVRRAKQRGSRVEVGAAPRRSDRRRLSDEAELRRGIARDELRLHYQPIVHARSERLLAFEALVRWEHPQRGLLGPGAFVELAEEVGLIVPLGEWVLRRACHDAAAWGGEDAPRVSVNVSPRQLNRPGLPATLAGALDASGLAPRRLFVELTESALIETDDPQAVLSDLTALGVRLALDDFGTGWSSLAILGRLPLDALKLDRAFITALADGGGRGERAEAVLRAVGDLGPALRLFTVAEGIETPDQLARARAAGFGAAQGFLFSRPIPGDGVAAVVARPPWDAVAG